MDLGVLVVAFRWATGSRSLVRGWCQIVNPTFFILSTTALRLPGQSWHFQRAAWALPAWVSRLVHSPNRMTTYGYIVVLFY